MTPLQTLADHGQSYWLDNLTRDMIGQRRAGAPRGPGRACAASPSNPAIFEKAISGSARLRRADPPPRRRPARPPPRSTRPSPRATSATPATCCAPCTTRPTAATATSAWRCRRTSPTTREASIDEARRLVAEVDRPNLMIKIPGTAEGLEAIETLLFDGINVNITLLFPVERYERWPRPTCARSSGASREATGRPGGLGGELLPQPHRRAGRRSCWASAAAHGDVRVRSPTRTRCCGKRRGGQREARLPRASSDLLRERALAGARAAAARGRSACCGPAPAPRTRPTATSCTSSR